jgi:hypothetical protein
MIRGAERRIGSALLQHSTTPVSLETDASTAIANRRSLDQTSAFRSMSNATCVV